MDMQRKEKRTIKVGIIQMHSVPLDIDTNLLHAGQLVEKVCEDGAQLVVLPELFSVGYSYSEELMRLAEDRTNGKTIAWLKDCAKRNRIHILTSIYEVDNNEYFNTMVMVDPNGEIQHYRKRNPFWQECSLFQQGEDCSPGIFDTELGRIGGIICFDAFSREAYENLKNNRVDLVVVVACWGIPRLTPEHPDLKYPKKMLEGLCRLATETIPERYGQDLKVPVVHVGQGGKSISPVPTPRFWPFSKPIQRCEGDFWGHSQVRDDEGIKLIEADGAEFYGVASIDLPVVDGYPEIKCIKKEASYLSSNKYIVQPPSMMAKLTQHWCHLGFHKEYDARRARLS